MKRFVSKIFKPNRSGKPDTEEDTGIEGCVDTHIQENYNLTPKTSPVDYADMLLTRTNNTQGKI